MSQQNSSLGKWVLAAHGQCPGLGPGSISAQDRLPHVLAGANGVCHGALGKLYCFSLNSSFPSCKDFSPQTHHINNTKWYFGITVAGRNPAVDMENTMWRHLNLYCYEWTYCCLHVHAMCDDKEVDFLHLCWVHVLFPYVLNLPPPFNLRVFL